ncbi:MAG: NAD(P)/FAD-dependent oxidoreductase [Treponema sp.]|nr:NAD(P)/FAD-dependent oxidoreductase [Treponema sp.]
MGDRYDIVIVGAGPAGMEAAITATVRGKKILLAGNGGSKGGSTKVQKAHQVLNYLGLPEISGEEMQSRFMVHLERMGIPIRPGKVASVYPMGEYFSLQLDSDILESRAIILACGVNFGTPLPGELEFLGRGVSYCATCDAALYKGKSALVVAWSKDEESEAAFLAEKAASVVYMPQYKGDVSFAAENIEVVVGRPLSIEGKMKAERLVCEGGSYSADGIFLLREAVAPDRLLPGLEMDGRHVKVDRRMATNIAGCFACGDIAGTPYQYIKAAGEGNVAALSAVEYLSHGQ